jgi:hypothetical protein
MSDLNELAQIFAVVLPMLLLWLFVGCFVIAHFDPRERFYYWALETDSVSFMLALLLWPLYVAWLILRGKP